MDATKRTGLGGTDTLVAMALLLGTMAFLFGFEPLARPVVLDPATWDLMSLGLLDGRIPYRDVFLHKTPGGALLGAVGAALLPRLPAVGLSPLEGAHALFIFLGAAGPVLLFVLCRRSNPLPVALAAALFMVAFDQWPTAALEGVRPKVATTVFGLAAILAAVGQRPLLAGLLGGLSLLCWQPGLCFLAGAAWTLSRGKRCGPDLGRLSMGAFLPLAAVALWLWSAGALGEFFEQAFVFNLSYIEWHARSPTDTVKQLWWLARTWNTAETSLAPLAAAGLAVEAWHHRAGPLTVAGLAYLALAFVSLQAWPDTILFAPFVAAGLAIGMARMAHIAARLVAPETARARTRVALLATLLLLSASMAATPSSSRMRAPVTFHEQAAFIAGLEAGLTENDRVLVLGFPEFSIHTGRASLWRWPYMWFGVDRFVAARTEGGFTAMLAGLERDDPALMMVARRWSGPLRRQFHEWARERYRLEERFFYPHTKRPIKVYRRRSEGILEASRGGEDRGSVVRGSRNTLAD